MIIKKVFYIKDVKKLPFSKKVLFIHLLSLNQIAKKEDLFFLNNRFTETLNCVQFTVMGSLFQS